MPPDHCKSCIIHLDYIAPVSPAMLLSLARNAMNTKSIITGMFKRIRQSLGLILFSIALSMLIWGEWHFPRQIKTVTINPTELSESNLSGDILSVPDGNPNSLSYRLVLETPEEIRLGDADFIHLTIAPEKPGINQIAAPRTGTGEENQGNTSSKPDSTTHIMAETRLELDGVLFEPTGDIIEPVQPDQTLSIYWTVQPKDIGVYRGVVWLHFQYVVMDESELMRKLISTQLITIKSEGFLGLRSDVARLIGSIGAVIGLALNIDLWIDMYHKFIQRRRKIIHA